VLSYSRARERRLMNEPHADIDIQDLVEEGIAVLALDMRVLGWNAAATRMYGWSRDEVLGGKIQSFVRCSPTQPLAVIVAQVLATGTWRGGFTRTTKRGLPIEIAATWALRRSASGAPIDIVETSRDVTEVRRIEESLRLVQHQYRNLFSASVASFWELDFTAVGSMVRELSRGGVSDLRSHLRRDPELVRRMIRATQVLNVNEQSLLMFGNGDREELSRNLDRLWPDESLPVFADSVAAAFEHQATYSADAVFVSLGGQRYDTLFSVTFPPPGSTSARVLVGITDITQSKIAAVERERSDRRYRDFFHFLPMALMHLDTAGTRSIHERARAEGVVDLEAYLVARPELLSRGLDGVRVVEVNRRAVEMLRASSADEFVGSSVARYWTESPEVFRKVMAARYANQPRYEAQIRVRAHDGTVLDALFYAAFTPVTGEPNRTLIGMLDISDRVRAQDALAQVQSEIAHAARVSLLGELTASIAHEVSQPLTAIETNTQASLLWLDRSPPNLGEVRELSQRTIATVQRAVDIIDRIRSLAVRSEPEHKDVEINRVVRESLTFLHHELERSGCEPRLELEPTLLAIHGDRVQLQQVIINLVVNAIQAMQHAAIDERGVWIGTRSTDGGLQIEIEDNGPGIPAEARPRLFESFFTTKPTGMGMGLPICRSIIEAHGGRISAVDRGTHGGARFLIFLPAHPVV
jgi:PAS domain S-box-containing protein